MIRIWSLALGLTLLSAPAHAQGLSPFVKYGKWVLVAGSAAMNYLAIDAHNQAEDVFDDLEAQCQGAHSRCAVGPDGSYLDPEIEALYQQTLEYDQTARAWLIGGETALAGAAVLFIWELTRPKGRPDNIPFEPEVRSMRGGTGLGLRIHF
jgi:hypothetical protein